MKRRYLALALALLGCGSRSALLEPIPERDAGSDACSNPDRDGDGHARLECGGDDCNDQDPSIHPGAPDPIESAGAWIEETVYVGGNPSSPALALDPAGGVHMAFGESGDDCTKDQLRFASRALGTWQVEEVGASVNGYQPALDFAPSGTAMIAFGPGCGEGSGVHFAERVGTGWQVSVLPASVSGWIDMSVAPDGTPHVAAPEFEGLDHFFRTSSGWQKEAIDLTPSSFYFPSIRITDNLSVHVAYHVSGLGELRHAVGGSGGYTTEGIDNQGYAGRYASLALEGSSVHIAYQAEDAGELRYATLQGDVWNHVVVASGGAGSGASLALAPGGEPHFVYSKGGYAEGTYYARRVGNGFEEEAIETASQYSYPSIAIEASGVIHIGFKRNGEVHHAYRNPENGIDQDCDGSDG